MSKQEQPCESFRSPSLLNTFDSALLVVDVQERLIPHIRDQQRIVWNIGRLLEGARLLDVNVRVTEQYPQGLGSTVEPLRELIPSPDAQVFEKTMFSCRERGELFEDLRMRGIDKLVLVGIESHVCVAQTALDLIAAGFDIYLCLDAVGSRFLIDHETAIRRLENAGALPVTTEAVLFDWCEKAGSDTFKQISKLVQEPFE